MIAHILVLSLGLLLLAVEPARCDGQAAVGATIEPLPQAAALTTPYIDPAYMLPFGPHSHWIQAWRSYLETLPASSYIKGSGIHLNSQGNPDVIARMLAAHGIKHARIEIGWGHLDYDNETDVAQLAHYRAQLAACKRWGVRPLILLNAHEGVPTPHRFFERTVAAAAPAGSRTIRLTDTTGLVIGRSGLSDVTTYRAAEILFTAISGNTLTLSKPLPAAMSAGQSVKIAVLKYRPFSVPGSADYNETLTGWNRYVATVADLAMDAMGTTDAADKGFDLEVWNELTFGSAFLDINNYYAPGLVTYDPTLTWASRLIEDTAQGVAANPRLNASVELVNGFANTVPWPASSQQPARVSGISHHPYPQYRTFPQDDQNTPHLNALAQEDSFVPSYSVRFPEYYGTWIQTESALRESSPLTNSLYGINHGRNARILNGAVAPVWGWITEVGMHPGENGITTAAAAHAFKAKVGLRLLTFYIGKGTKYVDLYSTSDGGDLGFALVQENFEAYARSNSAYPADDTAYTSPFLAAQGRMVARMSEGLDPTLGLAHTRSVQVASISDTHNHIQVSGDGSAAHPHLYNRDVLVILPYQVNATRFAIQYYVMTRDVRNDLAPEEYRVVLSGMNGSSATVTAYDPIRDVTVPVRVNARGSNTLDLTLTADDQPYLLIVDESGPPPSSPPPPPPSGCAGEMIVDNLAPRQSSPEVSFTGTWTTSAGQNPYGSSSLYSAGSGSDTYTWKPPVLTTGQACAYQVFVRWTQHPERSAMVPITVSGHTGGPTTRTFDERTGGGVWTLHGTYTFPAGAQPTVQVTDQNGQASADAVRFVPSVPDITPSARVTTLTATDPRSGGRLDLAWTTSTGDATGVLILRRAGAAVTDTLTAGQSYVAGQTLGSSTVVYVGAGAGMSDVGLTNGTTYHYQAFAFDAARNYASGAAASGTPTAVTSPCAGELVVDNLGPGQRSARVSFTGSWTISSGVNPFGANSLVSVGSGLETYAWTPPVFSTAQVCTYQVFVRWTQHANRSTTVPITVSGHAGGATTRTFDERTGGGVWTLHGTYTFPAGSQGTVQVTDQNGQASADAVRFVPAL